MKDHDSDNGDITLKDIVFHIQGVQKTMRGMEKRLSERIYGNSKGIQSNANAIKANAIAIKANYSAIHSLKDSMNYRFDSLEEDLYATMTDSLTIRKYVGMPVPVDD